MPRARSCWGQPAPLRSRRREGWGPPGQAGLPGWAGAACRPPRRRLPGAGQRVACCSRSPPALAPGQRPGSAAEQRARAAPSCSSSCCSLLLQRKREQEPVNADRQASAPGACPALPCPALPCPACSAVLSGAAGRAGSQQLEPRLPLSGSGSEAPESWHASGTAWPSPRPALLQAVGSSSRGSTSPQNQVQRPLPSRRVSFLLHVPSSLGGPSLHGDTQGTIEHSSNRCRSLPFFPKLTC